MGGIIRTSGRHIALPKEKKMKTFLRFLGAFLMVVGFGAVFASVEPMPGTPVEYTLVVAVAGFVLFFVGNWMRVAGGGESIFNLSGNG